MILRTGKQNMSGQTSVCMVVAGLLFLPIYIDLMGSLSVMIGVSTKIATYLYYGLLWLF